ncbi:MAG: ABC transporter substrate-binding protein, partial [Mycobacteriaceae bacterium]
APGGFTGALDTSIPFSGSRYSVASVDTDRGEVQLQRNDRFWGAPASLDTILLRRVSGAAEVAEALRTDDTQLALSSTDAATTAQLRAVPGLRNTVVPLPSVMQVTVRTTAPALASASVRRGVLGLLDPDALTTIGTGTVPRSKGVGTDESVLRDEAQLLAPSQPGYTPTAPVPLDPAQARTLIEAGGYTYSAGRYALDGKPLSLVVGADERDPVAVSIAQATADELTSGGIAATALATPATTLYAGGAKQADLIVGRAAVGGDLATMMASRFSCPPATTGSAVTSPAAPTTTPPTTTGTTTTGTATTAAPTATAPPRGANVSGLCDPSLQAPLRAALTGTLDAEKVAAELEPVLWAQAVVLPLYQDTRLLSVRPTLQGVSSDVTLTRGPLVGAARWTKSPS